LIHTSIAPCIPSAILKLTTAVQSIPIQQVANITVTVEAANGISTAVFTSSIVCVTLINICSNQWYRNVR